MASDSERNDTPYHFLCGRSKKISQLGSFLYWVVSNCMRCLLFDFARAVKLGVLDSLFSVHLPVVMGAVLGAIHNTFSDPQK